MGLMISFELDDEDLEHFRLIMQHARHVVTNKPPEEIIATASRLLLEIEAQRTPGFITDRLRKLKRMIEMISDVDWRLPHQEVNRVLNALAYFANPDDLIPDEIPGIGYLDDAIMIELVVRELIHEIDAYEEFCVYREDKTRDKAQDFGAIREELMERMRDRRRSDLQDAATRANRILD